SGLAPHPLGPPPPGPRLNNGGEGVLTQAAIAVDTVPARSQTTEHVRRRRRPACRTMPGLADVCRRRIWSDLVGRNLMSNSYHSPKSGPDRRGCASEN